MENEEYYARIARILDELRAGRQPTPEQQRELDQARLGIAPSHPLHRRIMSATRANAGPETVGELPGEPSFWDRLGTEITRPRGAPTLDWLHGSPDHRPGDTRPADTDLPNAAETADEQGEAPIGSGYEVDEFGHHGSGALGGFHGSGIPDDYYDDIGLGDFMSEGPGGEYSFADTPLGTREMIAQNPEIYANILYGDSPIQREVMSPFIESAQALAGTGILGYGRGDDLGSGPASSTMQLAAMEDMMRTMEEPGMQFVDPGQLYGELFSRVENTDPETMIGQNGGGMQDQIAITNQALFNAAPFMTEDSRTYLGARLDQAALEYMTLIATGETDMTYPEYLRSIGANEWMQE